MISVVYHLVIAPLIYLNPGSSGTLASADGTEVMLLRIVCGNL